MGVYGSPEVERHGHFWNLLHSLRPVNGAMWSMVGDFNEILSHSEKRENGKTTKGL